MSKLKDTASIITDIEKNAAASDIVQAINNTETDLYRKEAAYRSVSVAEITGYDGMYDQATYDAHEAAGWKERIADNISIDQEKLKSVQDAIFKYGRYDVIDKMSDSQRNDISNHPEYKKYISHIAKTDESKALKYATPKVIAELCGQGDTKLAEAAIQKNPKFAATLIAELPTDINQDTIGKIVNAIPAEHKTKALIASLSTKSQPNPMTEALIKGGADVSYETCLKLPKTQQEALAKHKMPRILHLIPADIVKLPEDQIIKHPMSSADDTKLRPDHTALKHDRSYMGKRWYDERIADLRNSQDHTKQKQSQDLLVEAIIAEAKNNPKDFADKFAKTMAVLSGSIDRDKECRAMATDIIKNIANPSLPTKIADFVLKIVGRNRAKERNAKLGNAIKGALQHHPAPQIEIPHHNSHTPQSQSRA